MKLLTGVSSQSKLSFTLSNISKTGMGLLIRALVFTVRPCCWRAPLGSWGAVGVQLGCRGEAIIVGWTTEIPETRLIATGNGTTHYQVLYGSIKAHPCFCNMDMDPPSTQVPSLQRPARFFTTTVPLPRRTTSYTFPNYEQHTQTSQELAY